MHSNAGIRKNNTGLVFFADSRYKVNERALPRQAISLHSGLFENTRRRKTIFALVLLLGAGLWAVVSGPRGLAEFLEKRAEIRRLQAENAALEAENASRRARIRRLEESRSEQELEIRKQLHLQRENEKTFILPSPQPAPPR